MNVKPPPPRKKTTVTLRVDLLQDLTKMSKEYQSRSQFIEMILQAFVAKRKREERDARDMAIINQNADYLNAEALDVLTYAYAGE